ncbi:hypothetical protein J2128_002416 [Methanomicrobium sp. W14]|uniref:hypothetical protein n=1 Tax=Methanomicrobium sp. W14 TaxID=2817839 RepID=UPI001AE74DA9|nr:hypothetical protein [Methanomicrobium sp. W14]MBP2134450.1 hypothetical protein [Methanomicrobium sp. W14]
MIVEIISSIIMLFLTLLIIFLSGLAISWILIPEKYKNSYFWILIPFLGISCSILILQTFIYLNIPLSISVFPFFILILIGTYIYYKQNNPKTPKIPKKLFILALIVILSNGIGYFALGPSNYLGYGWIDQYNYVATSQFLIDSPFSTSLDQVGEIPYLAEAIIKKDDRIGQSVLEGYVAVLSFQNAKTAYGAISLLSPLLVFFVIWIYSRRLIKDEWAQYGAAISAACIPGFALIHLQDFFSQALAVPFLLIFPLIIYFSLKEKDWHFIAIGIIIFAGSHSIYSEFTPLLIILAFFGMIWYILQTKEILSSLLVFFSIVLGGLVINVGYIFRSFSALTRGNIPNILQSIFPFSETVEGLGYLWFGYSGPLLTYSTLIFIVNFSALLLSIVAYTGIINLMRKQKDVITILLFTISLFPLVLLSQAEPYPYQFYKMLMAVSPLLMFGVWVLLSGFWEKEEDDTNTQIKDFLHPYIYKIPKIALICLLISSVVISGCLASSSITGGYRSAVETDNTKEMIELYNYLENTQDQDIILSISHPYPLAWAAYHGRNDRIFFINSVMGDVPLEKVYSKKFPFNNISLFPENATKITFGGEYPQMSPKKTKENLIAFIENPQGMEGTEGSEFNWLGKEMEIYLYWQGSKEQNINLSYLSIPGIGYPETNKRIVNISVVEGKSQTEKTIETDGTETVSIPLIIQPGLNVIKFKTRYPENASVIIPEDPRDFLVHISQMKITGEN